ncbi:MAG: aminotransferase class I/II-fold pyridoxal phosphate-dependent enzyme, partial [Christensenellales bacterium]
NAIVVSTFSKSRNLAGGRIGFVIANENLILDIEKMKYSFNPYSLGRVPLVAAKAAIEDVDYFKECVEEIIEAREYTVDALKELGFEVLPSLANFVLCRTDKIDGEKLYLTLKEKGILVRHLGDERIKDYVRITIGTQKQMRTLIDALGEIL